MTQLNGRHQHPVQGKEKRNLNNHRQTTANGIDLVRLVHGHHLLIHLGRIVFKLLFQLGDLGLQFLHVLHRLHTLLGNRPERPFDQTGQQNNRNAVVAKISIKEVEQKEHRLGQHIKPAKIDDLGQAVTGFL